ncbi:MAG: recombinase RecT, partial [Lachnospiraceae bacterium]|nr:recombinase RecT [Lachnospiraceae bacterium]
MAEALAKNESFSMTLTGKLDDISQALPKDFNKARFVQNALCLVNTKPELVKDFGQTQVMAGLLRGAMLGLDFFNSECYLVGYGKTLNYQTSYRGQLKLIRKYALNPVKTIYAEIVRENDLFETGIEKNQRFVTFKPIPFNN